MHLHAPDDPLLLRETLTALAGALPVAGFQRVHRSAVVARPEVVAMEQQPSSRAPR